MTKKESMQKFTWKQYGIYETFISADITRHELLKVNKHVKVRRCGPEGTKYKVKIGSLIEKPKTKKEKNNATK